MEIYVNCKPKDKTEFIGNTITDIKLNHPEIRIKLRHVEPIDSVPELKDYRGEVLVVDGADPSTLDEIISEKFDWSFKDPDNGNLIWEDID